VGAPVDNGRDVPGTIDRPLAGVRTGLALLVLFAAALLACSAAPPANAATRLAYATGKIVPIPATIPHEAGDMVDRRILPDLRWIAARYPIYVTDGYSGPLPSGEHVGCDNCHAHNSDHYNGLAVDLVPLGGGTRCDASWTPITRLALWAEPVQNEPHPPFRWVGYDGDAGHGCGNHLHLSWEHAAAPMFQLAEWVEVLASVGEEAAQRHPRPGAPGTGVKPPKGPQGGSEAEKTPPPPGPSGGISTVQAGGISSRPE
jgi:hypothetical protein